MSPSKLRWGLLFITAGILLLLSNMGHLSWDYWVELILTWWPVLLIAIGIEKLFQKTSLKIISYLAPILLVLGMIYLAIDIGSDRHRGSTFYSYRWSEEYDQDIRQMEAVIDHGKSDLSVSRSGIDLAAVRLSRGMSKPEVEFSKSDGIARLNVTQSDRFSRSIVIYDRDWRVYFSEKVPLKLRCLGEDSEIHLNLKYVPLDELTIKNDEGDIYLRVGTAGSLVRINIEGDEAQFDIDVPQGCGIKVAGDKYADYLEKFGLVRYEGNMRSPDFDSLDIKISLEIDDRLSHFSIGYY